MKRIALAGTIAFAAIAAAAFAAAGSAESPAKTSLHLVATTQESVGLALRHQEPLPGDRSGSGAIVTGDDTGIDRVSCTIISQSEALCTAVAQLSTGTLTGESLVSLQPKSAETRYAVTGGTGAYEGASGTAIVTAVPNTAQVDIQITLLP